MDDKIRQEHSKTALTKDAEQARLLAIDFSSDSELLRELAVSSDRATREAVAANPNTPPDVLLKLGAEFPKQLLENPIFSLLLLENLNLVEEIPLPTLRSILRLENVPLYILEKAADKADLEVQLALANNAQTPKQVLTRLAKSQHAQVKESAQLHVNLVGELTKETYEQKAKEVIQGIIPDGFNIDTRTLAVLAQLCPIPEFMVEHWVRESSYKDFFCRVIAYSPATPPNVLKHLAKHHDGWTQRGVAQNPSTPAETLRYLAIEQQGGSARFSVTENPNTPIDVLERLAKDDDRQIRVKVAQNPRISLTVLEELAGDRDRYVAETAANIIKQKLDEYDAAALRDPKTPTWVVEKLAKQEAYAVAAHPNPPLDLLLDFSKSKNWGLRKAVAENPNAPVSILEQLARDEVSEVRAKVAENPNVSVNLLEQLAQDDSCGVRSSVARNPRISLNTLFKQLARDARVNITIAYQMSPRQYDCPETDGILDLLAEESTSPLEIVLQRLVQDGGTQARLFLAQRSDLPVDLLEQLAQSTKSKVLQAVAQHLNTPTRCLEQLAGAKEPDVRQAVAKKPNTAIAILKQLAKDENYNVRMTIAEKTNLSSQILEELAGDKVQDVRQKAMANPNLLKEAVERILCGEYATDYLKLHPNFPASNPDTVAVILNHHAKSKYPLVSYIALCQPQICQEILQEKSRSISWLERFAVTQNLHSSAELLKRLAEDSNQLVRAAARNSLQKLF